MIRRLWLAGAAGALLLSSTLAAQAPAVISGRVVDAMTGAGIEGAELSLGDRAVTSGAGGVFRLSGITTGPRRLISRRIGYRPDTTSVDVLPGTEQSVTLALQPVPITVAAFAVTAVPAGAAVLDAEELRARGNDLGAALDGWAGVSVRRTGGGTAVPQVRGSAPE
ncbi:MAG: carboxypeptidase regulatory-like domain-containing protein, partial [Gemmatimonadales bacterium]